MKYLGFFYKGKDNCYKPNELCPKNVKQFYLTCLKKYIPFVGKKYCSFILFTSFKVCASYGLSELPQLEQFTCIAWLDLKESFISIKKLDIEQKQMMNHVIKDIYMDVIEFLTGDV